MGIIAKQSIKGTIVTYLGVAIGFVTTFFVLTHFLTTEEVGLVRVLIDAATLLASLASLGTGSSIIRFYPYFRNSGEDGKSDSGFFFFTVLVPLIGFAGFALLYGLCYAPLSAWFAEKSPMFVEYYYLVLPMAFFLLYQTIFETNANVLMRIVVPRFVREVVTRLGLLTAYLLYAFDVLSLNGLVISLCGVFGVCALINIAYLLSLDKVSFRPDMRFVKEHPEVVRKYILYTGFLIVSTLTSVLAPTLSSFFITAQMGLNYTGIFAVATYMAVMVSIPYRSLNAIAAPQLAAALKDDDRVQASSLMQQCANNLLLIGGLILLVMWVNIDLIYTILPNGETYAAARSTVFVLALSQLIMACFNITLSALNYSKYYAFTLLYSFLLTGGAIVLNNLLIPRWGMEGAAMSNLLSYAFYFLCIVITIGMTLHIHPFCRSQLMTVGLLIGVLVLNYVWLTYWPIENIWLSAVLRSVVLLGGACWAAYKLNISTEINALLHHIRL